MNEELIDKMFEDAVANGYSKDRNAFVNLLNSDTEVFSDMYIKFGQGQMNQDQFRSVITPKKKESSQVGSQKTQPTSGSKPAPSSNKPFAGSIDYLDQAPKFGEIPGAPKVPGTEGVVPAQKKVEQKPQQQQQPKRTIVRGEDGDIQIDSDLKKEINQSYASESTQPFKPVAPMTIEEMELQKVIEKESQKPAEFINYQDIDKLYSDPENSTKNYFAMFLENAKKSEKGDVEYGKNLRDAYAGEFIDEEFENEYRLSSEIDNIDRKMRTELASLSEKAKTDPNAANLLQTKTNEYLSIINKKQKELDSAREQNNQRFKNRIAEIDNLFKTGEAALREDSLLAEKNELVRKMNLIELAKNPNKLKDSVSKMEYDNIPGATAQDKLTNYLNSRLTAYDLFYNADKEADSLPQEMRGNIKDSYSKLKSELKDLYYLTSLRRYQNAEDRPGFFEATGEAFSREFLDAGIDFSDSPQIHSENLQAIAKNAGIEFSPKDKSYIETTSAPADAYSPEWWGDNFGSTLGFGANIAVSAPIGNTSLKIGEGIVKATPMFKKIAEYGLKRYSKLGGTGQKITNTIFNSLDEGYNFEMANQLIYDGESDELTFLTGVGGAIAAAPVNKLLSKTGKLIFGKADDVTEAVAGKAYTKEEAAVLEVLGAQRDDVRMALQGLTKENGVDDYVYMLQGTFGNKAPEAIKQIQKVGSVLIARPTGEVTQEMGEELTSIYKQSDSFEAFKKEFSKRFPDADAMTQFVVASYVMGLGFGAGNYVGDVFTAQSKKSFDQLPPDQQEIAAEAIREATEDINKADTETINEIELDEASRPKTKEEEEWSTKEGEIKQGIDSNTKRINELDGLKSQIYSNYNITDPKTEDISNISEEDARRLEILNSEIDKADKARIKDEIELELHNKNKPAVEQAPVNAIHAKDLKKEENAIQEPSAEEVLPRQQGATTETGGEPQGMGQDVQGEKVTQEGQEVSQEGVEEEVVDIKSMSSDELEKKQYEIEKSKDEKDKSLFNKIDKELENREWKSIMNAPLESIKSILDSLIEKNKTMPNGFSAYIDNTEARKVKSIVDKYSGEVSLNESEKDFKDAFFGNPSSSYSDGLKLRESARAYMDQGGSFKELLKKISNEFASDGFSEEDAAAVIKRKLDDVKRVNQEATQEGVTTLNQESFSEDVTPEQKAKVEEQNQKDEDESINEIYDFNDEIKSIGTKEQFKQFLRSLAPKAAFSRIAWHNTKKPELTPREGQYYTNTRKNAEDTYKQDNTFAAIVFGNAPKKASFDEVQQVDTNAVKGEGADIVVTDDLSPAIGADMNYREFVPTSADQVIPIGTKENIEAFKAFVEQQKASEKAKPATEQKVEATNEELERDFSSKAGNKAVDEKGEPISVYHASKSKIFEGNEFRPSVRGSWGEGVYFADSDKLAKSIIPENENVIEANIMLKNPLIVNEEEYYDLIKEYGVEGSINRYLMMNGYDGAIRTNYRGGKEYFVLDPNQIKILNQSNLNKNNIDELLGKKEKTSPTPQAQEVKEEKATEVESDQEKRAKEEAKVREYNKNAKENRGQNIKAKDFKTVKKRGQDLKVGDVYSRRIGDAVYVFKVLSGLRKSYGQFYAMDVEVLDTGTDYVRQELQVNLEIKEVGKKVGEKSIDLFKNLSSSSGGFNFGEVTVLQDYEAKTKKESNVEEVKETPSETVQAQEVEQEVAETSEFTEEETQSAIKEYEDIMSKPGIDKLDAKREFIEKYGALGERVVDIDSNFDNILDKLGAIKTCTIEIIRK